MTQFVADSGLWSVLNAAFWAVIVIGFLVFFHEFGHFVMAKLCGVSVLKFSLGFGKRLFGFKAGETDYMVSAVPLGGYVKMLGEEDFTDEFEGGEGKGEQLDSSRLKPEEYARSFMAQSVWKRMLIAASGPGFNIALTVILIYLLLITGMPSPVIKLSGVVPGSPAAQAGLKKGDIILKADGKSLDTYEQLEKYLEENKEKELEFTIIRDGKKSVVPVKAEAVPGKDGVGLLDSIYIELANTGMPAYQAGIRSGDEVISIEGVRLESWAEMQGIIFKSADKKLSFVVGRGAEQLAFDVVPVGVADETGAENGMVGIQRGSETVKRTYGPVESLGMSAVASLNIVVLTVDYLGKMITGKEDISGMAGPIGIAEMSARQAKKGLADLVWFMAVVSISLGVINLVPIPVLDGGMIFFLMVEGAMGRPLSMKKRELIQMIGLIIIVALMIFVFGSDILKTMDILPTYR